ncbi:M1 family aminopeptidase [Bowmanella denitrificans]|uniref:M1 family aminopeptidase n=1 Tax=Bowmanella denitrificans TaxID=366582 RepID=A0ABN0XN33_9ALTE
MFLHNLGFEWRYFTRQPSFIVTCLVFFLLPFLAMTIDNVQIGGSANTNFNSPQTIAVMTLILGVFAMFLVVNFIANTALRNEQSQMLEIVSSKPLKLLGYQSGRFLGSYLVCVTVFAMVPLGIFIGSLMPWLDSERIGANQVSYYLTPFLTFSLTSLLMMAALFYAAALRFRSVVAVYLTAVALFILYIISGRLLDEPEYRVLAALSDPYGLRAFSDVSRYWTPFERNTQVVGLEGVVLQNRLIWLTVALLILGLFGGLHKPLSLPSRGGKKATKADKFTPPLANRIDYKPSSSVGLAHFSARTGFEIRQVLKSPAFFVLLAFSSFSLISDFFDPAALYDAPNWPLTQDMLNLIQDSFSLLLVIVVTWYSAEAVWRERSVGMGDIVDAMPVFNLHFWLSKLLAVCLVILLLLFGGALVTMAYQLIKGMDDLELGQYLVTILGFQAPTWLLLTALAFFLQAISPNKYVGMLLFVAYFFISLGLGEIGLEHSLFNYAAAPSLQYSDMNGYGWFVTSQLWFMGYWLSLAVILGVVSYGLWQRGPQMGLKFKLQALPLVLGKTARAVLAAALLVFVGLGSGIYYNTVVLNTYLTSEQGEDLQERYERDFGHLEDADIPAVTAVEAKVDIFANQRRIEASAELVLTNKTDQVIDAMLVNLPQYSPSYRLQIEGGELGEVDKALNLASFTFTKPMQPGEQRTGKVEVVRQIVGFEDGSGDPTLVKNGTFINNYELFGQFGFAPERKLSDKHERRKRDLPELQRAYPLEDSRHYADSFFGKGVGLIDFAVTLSTDAEQTAIAPGYLTRQWQDNGRQYFRYEMDSPMVNFYSLMSARLAVKKQQYKGIDIEVYYHPAHHWNVDRMMESVRDSLDYFTEAFGPYQHRQMRIIEFPGYRSFAQSFANTVPYSERIGFISDLRDPEHIDPVYYVTAHEVAHQWWGHQVGAANVQGSAIISETLSQYSALMVMQHKYGEAKTRTFLTYELDRYLRGRTQELIEEMPLARAEGQNYIHYRKGSVVMMALKQAMGEAQLNAALKQMVQKWGGRDDRYPTTLDLMAELKAKADEPTQQLIDTLFKQISLYELQATDAKLSEAEQGFSVTLNVKAAHYVADGQGEEQEQPMQQLVDIMLFKGDPDDFGQQSQIVYRGKHLLKSGENQVVLQVDTEPDYAGVDPLVTLIDRDTDNNIIRISR